MKKNLKDLEVILLYISKVKGPMGLGYYLVKNNLSLPESTISVKLSLPEPHTSDYKEQVSYVKKGLMSIIKSFSSDWKKVGDKKVKLVLNTEETSVLLSLFVDVDGELYTTESNQTLSFDDKDIAFFGAVGISAVL